MKVFAPVTGKVENLDFVSDPVFSKRMLGDGIAILPENNQIFSPVSVLIPWNCRASPFAKQ